MTILSLLIGGLFLIALICFILLAFRKKPKAEFSLLRFIVFILCILAVSSLVLWHMFYYGLLHPVTYLSFLFTLCGNIIALIALYSKKNLFVLIVGIVSAILFSVFLLRVFTLIQAYERALIWM